VVDVSGRASVWTSCLCAHSAHPPLLLPLLLPPLLPRARAGKTQLVERANRMVNHGYTAIYFFNAQKTYQMAAGLMRVADTGVLFDVDVQIPETKW
jgi:hypothetical protein